MGRISVKKSFWLSLLSSTIIIAVLAMIVYQSWLETPTEHSPIAPGALLTEDAQAVYEPVLPGQHVSLPKDFKTHPEYQHEWWNYYANLKDEKGKTYNVQWAFMRIATDDRQVTGWQNPQLYFSYIVISSGTQLWREQRVSRGGIGQAGSIDRPFRLWIDNWNWRSLGITPFPGNLNVNTDLFGMELNTVTNGPFVLNGERGYQVKHELQGLASFSFSAPFLNVQGRLTLGGEPVSVVGKAWVEKEWGTNLLGSAKQGWDKFHFNLDDGRSLTVTNYRYMSNTPNVYGTIATRSGKVIALTQDDISVRPLQVSKLSNESRIPLQWIINVPEHGINLTTRITNSKMWLPFLVPYWEGGILASGSNEATGFMQLVGY